MIHDYVASAHAYVWNMYFIFTLIKQDPDEYKIKNCFSFNLIQKKIQCKINSATGVAFRYLNEHNTCMFSTNINCT